ncbi:unnamed protein product [Brassicogethes aeneus]|uniref:Endonuclease/exonuclease/phosphatase domain-containing protein n=1 Tax=Brassicogethes aeneus TaxID=1431903 RepID=A0A9P0ARG5_BRAAE|nr:unnamed protein product [Brassicogethes aeneus]
MNKDMNNGKENINMGTWNLRGVYEAGALKSLIRKLNKYNMDLVALQETHLTGNEITFMDNFTLFTSGSNRRRYGVGFLIKNSLKGEVKYFKPISDSVSHKAKRVK